MRERGNALLRKADRYLGVPACFLLGLLRRRGHAHSPFMRIALLQMAAIGDTVMLQPVVDAIRRACPQASLEAVCSAGNLPMMKLLPGIDCIHVFHIGSPLRSLWALHGLPAFDLLLDFAPWPRISALAAACIRAGCKVGFQRRQQYRHYVYDLAVQHSDSEHELSNYGHLLQAAGLPWDGRWPSLRAEPFRAEEPYTVLHCYPGGSSQAMRSWPPERWLELAMRMGGRFYLTGGREDAEAAGMLAEQMRARGLWAESVAGRFSLAETMSLLAGARLLVTVNTGIMHIGASLGIPLVALHGATSPLRWGPLSEKAVVLQSGEPCQPCISLGFETCCADPVCMSHITVDMVQEAAGRALQKG